MPCSDQSWQTASTASVSPEMTDVSADALMAATTSVRPASRRSASAKGNRTRAMAPLPITDRNPRAR